MCAVIPTEAKRSERSGEPTLSEPRVHTRGVEWGPVVGSGLHVQLFVPSSRHVTISSGKAASTPNRSGRETAGQHRRRSGQARVLVGDQFRHTHLDSIFCRGEILRGWRIGGRAIRRSWPGSRRSGCACRSGNRGVRSPICGRGMNAPDISGFVERDTYHPPLASATQGHAVCDAGGHTLAGWEIVQGDGQARLQRA